MSETPDPGKKGKAIEPGSEIADLAGLLATVNRISDRLQKGVDDLGVRITVTDWLLMRVLQEEGPLPMADIARRIGVTRQRVHQQTKAGTAAKLFSASEGADAKTKPLSLTDEGRALLGRLEENFKTMLSTNTGAMPTGPIHGTKLGARRILRAMSVRRPEAVAPGELKKDQ